MSNIKSDTRRQPTADTGHPPFHVILSYLPGTCADIRVISPDRAGSKDKESRS